VIFVFLGAHAAKAASCVQMNDRVFGVDGRGGVAARFRDLRVKIDEETRNGQTQAAAGDRAELSRLAASILVNAKVMQTVHCTAHIVPQANAATSNGAGARSAHGCVGFNGLWQTASGNLLINNGAGGLREFSFSGSVSGNMYSGGWSDSKTGERGTFVFTLAPDGDSMFGRLTNSFTGGSGSYTSPCVGALPR
jgi:hypothetical protein